jgi:hypothetical protein
MCKGDIMRNPKDGILTTEWKDITLYDGWNDTTQTFTQKEFEKHYGTFISALYVDEHSVKPYCIWTDGYVVHPHKDMSIESFWSFPREPKVISFG